MCLTFFFNFLGNLHIIGWTHSKYNIRWVLYNCTHAIIPLESRNRIFLSLSKVPWALCGLCIFVGHHLFHVYLTFKTVTCILYVSQIIPCQDFSSYSEQKAHIFQMVHRAPGLCLHVSFLSHHLPSSSNPSYFSLNLHFFLCLLYSNIPTKLQEILTGYSDSIGLG